MVVLTAAILPMDSFAQAKTEISRDEARTLLQLALRLGRFRADSSHFEIEDIDDPDFPGYYSFGAYDWDYPELQNVVGWYRVDKRTGAVWNWMLCERYEYPQLAELRTKIVGTSVLSSTKKTRALPRPCLPEARTKVVRKPRKSPS